jgi:hypothetical protein
VIKIGVLRLPQTAVTATVRRFQCALIWVAFNVRLGRLNRYLLGPAIGRWPRKRSPEEHRQCSSISNTTARKISGPSINAGSAGPIKRPDILQAGMRRLDDIVDSIRRVQHSVEALVHDLERLAYSKDTLAYEGLKQEGL